MPAIMKGALPRKRSTPRPQREAGNRPYRECKDGYDTLHPRKGWKHVSSRRLLAQTRLRYMMETGRFVFGAIKE